MTELGALLSEDGTPSKVGLVYALAWAIALGLWVLGGLHLEVGPVTYTVPRLEVGTLTSILTLATSGLVARKAVTRSSSKTSTEQQP